MCKTSPACGKQTKNGSITTVFLSCRGKWIIFCFVEPKSWETRSSREAESGNLGTTSGPTDTAPVGYDLSEWHLLEVPTFPSLLPWTGAAGKPKVRVISSRATKGEFSHSASKPYPAIVLLSELGQAIQSFWPQLPHRQNGHSSNRCEI